MSTGKVSWPPGQYALPMPKAGCPDNWFEGRRFHDTDTSGTLLIDQKIYESLHLAGWISKEGIVYNFRAVDALGFMSLRVMT